MYSVNSSSFVLYSISGDDIKLSRYEDEGFDPMMIVDFQEATKKPNFKDREGYFNRRPNGPFLISADDVRENIQVSVFTSVGL